MIDRALLVEASALFNRKLYFECHDLLEGAWSESRGEDRGFLQALIHVSVGLYHLAAGNHQGAKNLLERGIAALEPLAPEHAGLDLAGLLPPVRRCLAKSERALSGESIEWEAADVPVMKLVEVE
ncbi:MAG: DUF309 domain-containing protein [Vicinamibacteria bacterium]